MDSFFYIKVAFLCVVILSFSLYSYFKFDVKREKFNNSSKSEDKNENKEKTIILLGDSILNNEAYVKNNQSILNLVKKKREKSKKETNTENAGDVNVFSFAQNNASIVDIYQQLREVPLELNNQNTSLFLSVGGNDILTQFAENNEREKNDLKPMFFAYKKLIDSIQTKMDQVGKIVIMNIYYPTNMKYKQYKPILEEWNQLLEDYVREKQQTNEGNTVFDIIRLNYLLTEPTDFTLSIEPSETGGIKIADNIILQA